MKKFLTLFVAALMSLTISMSNASAQTSDVDSATVPETMYAGISDDAAEPDSTQQVDAVKIQQMDKALAKTPEVFFPNRNQFSFSYGDGYAMPVGSVVLEAAGTAFATALAAPFIIMFGGKVDDIDINVGSVKTYGIANFGYRHLLPGDRFALGFDVAYSKVQRSFENSTTAEDGTAVTNVTKKNSDLFYASFGATCYYKRRGWCKLYGSVGVGIVASKHLHDAMAIYNHNVGFAYDFTPIGIQMGNDTVSGFAELSLGYKGFLSAGVRLSL